MIPLQSRAGSPRGLQHLGQRLAPLGLVQPFRGAGLSSSAPACSFVSQFNNTLMHFALKYSSGREKLSLPLGLPLCKNDQF